MFGPFDPNPALLTSGFAVHVGSGLLPGRPTIDPNVGWVAQALGKRAALEWIHGNVPWWNPFEGIGMPLAGNMQSAAMFPTVIFMLLQNGLLLSHMLLEAATGAATYALLRRLGLSIAPSSACAAAFALNGTFAWFSIAPVNVIVSLPIILLGIEMARSASVGERSGGWVLIAVGVALSIYGGFPETAVIDGALAVLWTLARIGGLTRGALLAFAAKVGLGVLSGVLIAAPILVAFLDDVKHAYVGIHGASLSHVALPGSGSVQLAFPYFLGPVSGFNTQDPTRALTAVWGNVGGYLNTTLLVLAGVALIASTRRPYRGLRWVLAGWTFLALGRTYGLGFAVSLLSVVPGLDHVAFYRYASVSVEMSLVVLAAFGIEDLLTMAARERLIAVGGACAVTVLAGLLLIWEAHRLANLLSGQEHLWEDFSIAWGFALVAVAFSLSFLSTRTRCLGLSGLVLLDATALFVVPQFSAPRGGSVDNAAVSYLRAHLGHQRAYAVDLALEPNYGSYFGIAELDTDDLPVPNSWITFVKDRLDSGSDPITFDGDLRGAEGKPSAVAELSAHLSAFREAGVALVVAPSGVTLPPPLSRTWSDSAVTIYRLAGAAPLFSTVGVGACSTDISTTDNVRVTCTRPATLIREELDQPGWHAAVDGRPAKVADYEGVFQSVRVPEGTSRVTYSFQPPHILAGWAAGAAGLILVAAGLFVEVSFQKGRHYKSWKL